MKIAALIICCILQSVSAAPNKRRPLSHRIPSFVPPSIRHDNSSTKKANLPLLIRGGQQVQQVTSSTTSRHYAIIESFATYPAFTQYNTILATVNLLGLGISLVFPRMQYHLDLLGTGAFALASVVLAVIMNQFMDVPLRCQVSTVAVVLWSVKLAAFLFFRACKVKTDVRLEGLLSSVSGTFAFWTMSFLWGVVSSLPHSLGLSSTMAGNQSAVILGAMIYTVGLLMETLADYQKWMWKQSHPGKFCSGGLWSISQHPNFFGNFLIWSGIAVMNLPALVGPIGVHDDSLIALVGAALWSCRKAVVALLSPAFLWLFFNGQASGSIGSGVEESMKRYGDDHEFRKYIDSVSLLVPDLSRIINGN